MAQFGQACSSNSEGRGSLPMILATSFPLRIREREVRHSCYIVFNARSAPVQKHAAQCQDFTAPWFEPFICMLAIAAEVRVDRLLSLTISKHHQNYTGNLRDLAHVADWFDKVRPF